MFLLRAKEMTVSQIAADLDLTPQAVYHHIKKLLNAEMVEVAREERIDHLIESYYRATAEVFNCSVGNFSSSRAAAREQTITALNGLKRLGFDLEVDDAKIDQLIDLLDKMGECCNRKYEDKVVELEDIDFVTKQALMEYADVLSMTDRQFAEHEEYKKQFRALLNSLLKK